MGPVTRSVVALPGMRQAVVFVDVELAGPCRGVLGLTTEKPERAAQPTPSSSARRTVMEAVTDAIAQAADRASCLCY